MDGRRVPDTTRSRSASVRARVRGVGVLPTVLQGGALGFGSLPEFLSGFWEQRYSRRDPNNLLALLRTWQLNDVGATPERGGSLVSALGSIKAKATVMAAQTDLYFTPADIEAEAQLIPGARFRLIPTAWGHMAGSGLSPTDALFIQDEIKALLAS